MITTTSSIIKNLSKHLEQENILLGSMLCESENSLVFEALSKKTCNSQNIVVKKYLQNQSPSSNLSLLVDKQLPFVIKILRVHQNNPKFVCMQLCKGGNLKRKVQQNLSGIQLHRFAYQIALGICSLKQIKLMHADLKPENIFLNESGDIKIGDLDYILKQQEFSKKRILVGTLQYMAPQTLSQWQCSYSSDIWSFGVLLFELYFGYSPFDQIQSLNPNKQSSIKSSLFVIRQRVEVIRQHVKNHLGKCNDMMASLVLQVIKGSIIWQAKHRMTIQEILKLLQKPFQRKGSISTDATVLHQQDDIFIFPNSRLQKAFSKLNNILQSLPQEKQNFNEITNIISIVHQQSRNFETKDLLSLQEKISQKYLKMRRNFKRLSNTNGGISYSNKGKIFSHLKYLLDLLQKTIQDQKLSSSNRSRSTEYLP